jgi:hypothetical protein
MAVVAPLVIIVVLLAVVAFIALPLRAGRAEAEASEEAMRVADLLARREAKYREIRELDLDRRTGKVAEADFRVQDRRLRADAIAILRELDDLGVGEAKEDAPAAEEQAPAAPQPITEQAKDDGEPEDGRAKAS